MDEAQLHSVDSLCGFEGYCKVTQLSMSHSEALQWLRILPYQLNVLPLRVVPAIESTYACELVRPFGSKSEFARLV